LKLDFPFRSFFSLLDGGAVKFPFEGRIQTTMLQHSLEIFPLVRSTVFKKKNPKPTQQKQIPNAPTKQVYIHLSWEDTSWSKTRTEATFVTKSLDWEQEARKTTLQLTHSVTDH